jgi:hypothetical protein
MTKELEDELHRLKRGAGLAAADLAPVVGARLKEVCRIGPDDGPDVLRSRVCDLIRRHAAELPEDLRLAVLVALALHPEATHRFLTDRLRWAALPLFNRDSTRTIDRLANRGLERIAESIEGEEAGDSGNQYVPGGWYYESLSSTYRLDLAPPQLRERRRIVATRDGLDVLVVSLSAPRCREGSAPPHIRVEVVAGGEMVGRTQVGSGHLQGNLQLPRPLRVGERHDYEVVFVPSSRASIQPYYLLTPLRRHDNFDVGVRFGRSDPPDAVWRLDGVPRVLADEFGSAEDLVSPDEEGWVHARFHFLYSGLSYGFRWSYGS